MILSLALGIIQGITEFLPISSSGHLYLISTVEWFKEDKISFFVWLHLATFFTVVVFFYKEIIINLRKKQFIINIAVATFFTSLMAMGINKYVGKYFDSPYLIFSGFMITTTFLLLSRYCKENKLNLDNFSLKEAIIFGIVQGITVVPGISRSGITISTLIRRGFNFQSSFQISFLASLPVILAAFIFESPKIINNGLKMVYVWGFFSAFLSGLLALTILKKIIKKRYMYYFGYYCFLIGIFSLVK